MPFNIKCPSAHSDNKRDKAYKYIPTKWVILVILYTLSIALFTVFRNQTIILKKKYFEAITLENLNKGVTFKSS